jgi:T5SS/PEP-CTERM-associated repeat protein
VTVAGTGSTWTSYSLCVGYFGSGRLNIANRGTVSSGSCSIGYSNGSSGWGSVVGTGSVWSSVGGFYVGNSGSGTLNIRSGGSVSDGYGYIGYATGSTGTATVDGAGSLWTNVAGFYVGNSGSGTLDISDGGTVSTGNGRSYIGYANGASGTVTVDAGGSKWTSSSFLYVGNSGSGALSISGGGAVVAGTATVNNMSLTSVDVGRGSSLTMGGGTGTITNNGVLRVVAGAGVAADGSQYSPIAAGSWGGTGTYQAIGGTWSTTSHKFTASSITRVRLGGST